MKKLSFIVIAILLLTACSTRYSSNGESLYLRTHNGNKIDVPHPLTNANISNYYDLPAQTQDAQVSVIPPR